MSKGYINQAQKQAICGIVGINVFVKDTVAEGKLPNFESVKDDLQTATECLDRAINSIMSVLDENVRMGILRYSRDIDLICISKGDPRGTNPMHLVTEDEMLWLIHGHHDCLFCEKNEKQIKHCELRKIALRCQLIPAGKGECPFYRDM